MRKYIDIVNEAVKPTKTGTRNQIDLDFMPSLEPKAVATQPKGIPGTKTRKKPVLRAIDLTPETGAQVSGFGNSLVRSIGGRTDIVGDEVAHRNAGRIEGPNNPDNLPAVIDDRPTNDQLPAIIHKEVAETGGRVNPEWTSFLNLPGYVQGPIRAVGRELFGQFTDTPVEEFHVLTTLGDINSQREVVGMMDWIKRHGVRDDSVTIDFSRIMPGYTADATLWRTEDFDFLLVKDFGGYYIWACVGGRGVHVGHQNHLRIGHD